MKIWPAIDLRGGNCVRLKQGDYNQETGFGDDPGAMAQQWCEQGAECMHLVGYLHGFYLKVNNE